MYGTDVGYIQSQYISSSLEAGFSTLKVESLRQEELHLLPISASRILRGGSRAIRITRMAYGRCSGIVPALLLSLPPP